MPLEAEHLKVIKLCVEGEVDSGRILGPFTKVTIAKLQVNWLGVVPKGHTLGKWWLVTDLSFPEGTSGNDGINHQLRLFQYTSINIVARAVQALGRGALLAKLDIKSV